MIIIFFCASDSKDSKPCRQSWQSQSCYVFVDKNLKIMQYKGDCLLSKELKLEQLDSHHDESEKSLNLF